MNAFNWGEALKADLTFDESAASSGERKPVLPIMPGRYAAFVDEIKQTTFKKGSFGLTVTYVLAEGQFKNRKIRDFVVLQKADQTPVTGANARLKRMLMAMGLGLEKLNAFKGPRHEHDLGDFRHVISAPVTIIVKDGGEFEGRPTRKVAGVYLRSLTNEAA